MLHPDEENAVAERFGVARGQVRRDHLISHLLAAISTHAADEVIFFGGTRVVPDHRTSRTPVRRHRPDRPRTTPRHRRETRNQLIAHDAPGVPRLRWQPPLTAVRDTEPALLTTTDGVTVRLQLLRSEGYPPWPTTTASLVQRYRDAPSATLTVPTAAAFAAAKTVAWMDRATCRDLFDLWLLAQAGAISTEAARLFTRYGPTTPPTRALFAHPPQEPHWRRDLSGQTRLTITAHHAATIVGDTWDTTR